MRKLFCIFAVFAVVSPAFAEGEQQQSLNKADYLATASYVEGAYNSLNTSKQDKLTSTNVTESGTGPIVTGVTASNGSVTVTKSEIVVPLGSASNPVAHAAIWVQ